MAAGEGEVCLFVGEHDLTVADDDGFYVGVGDAELGNEHEAMEFRRKLAESGGFHLRYSRREWSKLNIGENTMLKRLKEVPFPREPFFSVP